MNQTAKKPRLTAAERRAAQAQEALAREQETWANFGVKYHERMMAAMWRYMNTPSVFSVTRKDDSSQAYVFLSHAGYESEHELPVKLPQSYSWELISELESVERNLERYDEHQREQERLAQVRRDALAKLSGEELAVLGIKAY